MFAKKIAIGIATGVLALAFAPAANATVFHVFHVGDMPNFYLTSGTPFSDSITANFGNGYSSKVTFDDKFLFTIPQDGTGSGSISTSFSAARNKLTITELLINGIS
ncbi:MAG: hypothetical protein JWR77_526, partial [Rhizorhabdus sp.]|nr:hypothetical protein [Rhizorhabdus sp.]